MNLRTVVPAIAAAALMSVAPSLYAADQKSWDDKTIGEKTDDAVITSKVKMELMGNRETSALRTEVDTNDGVVTLTGKAKNSAEKELATQVAKKVKGVIRVENRITVEP